MSNFTDVILAYSVLEEPSERNPEIDAYPNYGGGTKLGKDLEGPLVGGHMEDFNAYVRVGIFNHFMLGDFIEYLRTKVRWKYPEFVRVFARQDDAFEQYALESKGCDG